MAREATADLPGDELVSKGLADIHERRWTIEALLVAIGAPRLRRLGVRLPPPDELPDDPELTLYRTLSRERPRSAHSGYNALIRRLVSFERALEARRFRSKRMRIAER